MKRVLTGLAVAAVVAAFAPAASAIRPCDPWDIQCQQNCGPQVDTSGKYPRIYTVNC